MHTIQLPDATYQHLAAEAVARNMTVEELAVQRLEAKTLTTVATPTATLPLTGEAWQKAFDRMNHEIAATAHEYPPGFQVDDSRDTIYTERLERQR